MNQHAHSYTKQCTSTSSCCPQQCYCCTPCPCPPKKTCPLAINFPQQCRIIFPGSSCNCQGFVSATSGVTAVFSTIPSVIGTGTINSTICPLCNPGATTFTYQFIDALITNSFNFEATLTQTPTCNLTNNLLTSVLLSGFGTLQLVGIITENVPFSLTLFSSGGICTYTLSLNTGGLILGIPTISIGSISILCGSELSINQCVNL